MTANREFEDLRAIIGDMVSLFKVVHDEVGRQFSDLPAEERHRIFSLIAPCLVDLFAMVAREDTMGDETRPKSKRKNKK